MIYKINISQACVSLEVSGKKRGVNIKDKEI